jgi:hypothetical protein
MIGKAVAGATASGVRKGRARLGRSIQLGPSLLTIIVGLVAAASAAAAAPSLPSRAAVAPVAAAVPIDARCGQGWHWVPPHYAKHAKWRAGRCSRN